jgi:LysM repeat protein
MIPLLRNNQHICNANRTLKRLKSEVKNIRMKKFLSLAACFLCSFMVFAQTQLIVRSSDQGLYLEHKVAAKENFYSIGRLYHVSAKDIESFNGLDMNKGLSIGQTLKVPLNASNFSQTIASGQPVYYVVGTGEGLYRVSQKNGTVLMADLRKWNKLSSDKVNPGQKLIVGYLLPSQETGSRDLPVREPEVKQQPIEQKKEPIQQKQEVVSIKQEEPKKEEPEKKMETPVSRQVTSVTVNDGSGGYFKSQFDLQIKNQPVKSDQTASAGIFKTSSGWQDAKYYALIDNVEPGTIIKVINPTNNKAIYAKVLGEMSGIRQNQGYDVRISNAAASALDVTDTDKFIVRVNY